MPELPEEAKQAMTPKQIGAAVRKARGQRSIREVPLRQAVVVRRLFIL